MFVESFLSSLSTKYTPFTNTVVARLCDKGLHVHRIIHQAIPVNITIRINTHVFKCQGEVKLYQAYPYCSDFTAFPDNVTKDS